ncbi:hypothetical protein KAFR_0I01890 [Kazachstania africana CBS 2517]|uniref:Uncharacterized protein n=1 Tax=Kazachstania africana (strain ATCC 22294 / BCRC 22015 / CBS 2517 / CECT 1963 / NBRC 1671 / NRRL Y-8276) TaxID=1071382 RepID=H2B019_KAZAF|nr:hypothetical protein KAFR_0I01890 [Kazachstania africana CBS 2517]CCF59969.1 hypothetical protein KAFR_0I01890 [Kazachstania africana CBS 2517]
MKDIESQLLKFNFSDAWTKKESRNSSKYDNFNSRHLNISISTIPILCKQSCILIAYVPFSLRGRDVTI